MFFLRKEAFDIFLTVPARDKGNTIPSMGAFGSIKVVKK